MFNYLWPLAMIVASNTFYQICAKACPESMNPFASLTVTYLIAFVWALFLYFVLSKNANLLAELRKVNWAPFGLGFVIVGLEVGFIYAFKNGWSISAISVVSGSLLAIVVIFLGAFVYRENITWNKILGAAFYMTGIFFINMNTK